MGEAGGSIAASLVLADLRYRRQSLKVHKYVERRRSHCINLLSARQACNWEFLAKGLPNTGGSFSAA